MEKLLVPNREMAGRSTPHPGVIMLNLQWIIHRLLFELDINNETFPHLPQTETHRHASGSHALARKPQLLESQHRTEVKNLLLRSLPKASSGMFIMAGLLERT